MYLSVARSVKKMRGKDWALLRRWPQLQPEIPWVHYCFVLRKFVMAPGQAMKVLPVIVLLHISKIDTASSYTSTSTLNSILSPLKLVIKLKTKTCVS